MWGDVFESVFEEFLMIYVTRSLLPATVVVDKLKFYVVLQLHAYKVRCWLLLPFKGARIPTTGAARAILVCVYVSFRFNLLLKSGERGKNVENKFFPCRWIIGSLFMVSLHLTISSHEHTPAAAWKRCQLRGIIRIFDKRGWVQWRKTVNMTQRLMWRVCVCVVSRG
jgi:hypothetical protein